MLGSSSKLCCGWAQPKALRNDVTMLPVASDNASPSALPEIPSMPQILFLSLWASVVWRV